MKSNIIFSSLMCHAPIVIPEISKSKFREVQRSTEAMNQVARTLFRVNPDIIVILSPHSPRGVESFTYFSHHKLIGDFSLFGHSEMTYSFNSAIEELRLLLKQSEGETISFEPIERDLKISQKLDHGALVPLHFIKNSGWQGELIVIGLPQLNSYSKNRKLGSLLQKISLMSKKRWAIVASGDMSHRLLPDAPAGFHPLAKKFDQTLVELMGGGRYQETSLISEELREIAAEDVMDTLDIALSSIDYKSEGLQFLSYEGPFGVGYFIQILYWRNDEKPT